jgi:hypothetical protein
MTGPPDRGGFAGQTKARKKKSSNPICHTGTTDCAAVSYLREPNEQPKALTERSSEVEAKA